MLARRFAFALVLLVAALVPVADVLFATPQAAKARKVAFLVGVGKYDHKFGDLGTAPENDVSELADTLAKGGFEVVTLTGTGGGANRATKANIESRFKDVLRGGGTAVKDGDTVLVVLCGHGIQDKALDPATGKNEEQPFYCPVDAWPDDTKTMVPLNGLIRASEASGATTLFLVDACREVPPDVNRGTRTGIQGKKVLLPAKTAVLFSCGQGQLAHQDGTLGANKKGHGLFTYAVLKTLRGDGEARRVSWTRLVAGVEEAFESDEFKKLLPVGMTQSPLLATGELGATELLAAKPSGDIAKEELYPGKVLEFEVADGVKMKFCWIPAGKATLGSPKEEKDRSDDEAEREYDCKGFWLGKYEVTQDEWVKVMGVANPSAFASTGTHEDYRRRVAGMDTKRFPVERVSWNDCQLFLKKVNARPGAKAAFGKARKFVLPTEDEWEYACRGGKGNRQAFYFGDVLDGTQANCDGKNYPYGKTEKNGVYLERPCAVDDTSLNYPKHPWGLFHMHGNVWEWC